MKKNEKGQTKDSNKTAKIQGKDKSKGQVKDTARKGQDKERTGKDSDMTGQPGKNR